MKQSRNGERNPFGPWETKHLHLHLPPRTRKFKNTTPIIKQSPWPKPNHSSSVENTCTYRSIPQNFKSRRIGAQIWRDRGIQAAEGPATGRSCSDLRNCIIFILFNNMWSPEAEPVTELGIMELPRVWLVRIRFYVRKFWESVFFFSPLKLCLMISVVSEPAFSFVFLYWAYCQNIHGGLQIRPLPIYYLP